jgi:3-hydroxypropionate dehydrogenase (NADP+)
MEISKVVCIGSGLIGQGWATLFSSKGYEVTLQDISEAVLKKAFEAVALNLQFLASNHFIISDEAESALEKVKTTVDLAEALDGADYVQESVPDRYDLKRSVFTDMDNLAPSNAILASSASGLLMTEIQKVTICAERCVLVHPILPVHLIPVVEISGGQQTSRETMKNTFDFMKALGKIPVMLNREVPGYIVNRLQAALLREAIDLVDKGIASPEDIDKAFCMGIGLRDPFIGPFRRMHLAGDGIEQFFEKYSQSYSYRWQSMDTWTTVPTSAVQSIVKGVYEMDGVHHRSVNEIRRWRDGKIVKILEILRDTSDTT